MKIKCGNETPSIEFGDLDEDEFHDEDLDVVANKDGEEKK
jgi:hypothetical protein